MPSQLAHALFADEVARTHLDPDLSRTVTTVHRAFLLLGAQGPDLFLHGVRRKPRGVYYGTILHRKGNAPFLAELALGMAQDLDIFAYLLGWISHVALDRALHPFVNYHAGWRGVPDKHPDRRFMHAFLERCMDVQIVRDRRGVSVDAFPFYPAIAHLQEIPPTLAKLIVPTLRSTLRPAREDAELERRVANAYLDMIGFYAFMNHTPRRYFVQARRRELSGEFSGRWLSVAHPLPEWLLFDTLNSDHRWWHHPCPDAGSSNASVRDLWGAAMADARAPCRALAHAWDQPHSSSFRSTAVRELQEAVGDRNLNDGLPGEYTCLREHAGPLPLIALYDRIKRILDRETAIE